MWNSPFKLMPANGQVVWLRVITIYGELVVATYNSVTQTFTTNVTAIVIPAYMCARWKVYP